jgi:hypothetical protein
MSPIWDAEVSRVQKGELAMKKQYLFRNYYKCYRCHEEWEDVWSATCDDDCPHCGARHCSPYKSEDEEESL